MIAGWTQILLRVWDWSYEPNWISSIQGKSVIDEGCTASGDSGLCIPSVFFTSNFGFVKEHFSVVCRFHVAMVATTGEKGETSSSKNLSPSLFGISHPLCLKSYPTKGVIQVGIWGCCRWCGCNMEGRPEGQGKKGSRASVAAVCAVSVLSMTQMRVYPARISRLHLWKMPMSCCRKRVCVWVAHSRGRNRGV